MTATPAPSHPPGPSLVHIALLLGCLVLLVLGFSGTWSSWSFSEEGEQGTFSFSRSEFEIAGDGSTRTFSYETPIGPLGSLDEIEGMFDWTTTLLILATISVLTALMLHVAPLVGVILPFEHVRIAKGAVVAAAVLALLAPVQVWLGFPGAVDEDLGAAFAQGFSCPEDSPTESFWGRCEDEGGSVSWGASTAWWGTLAAGLVASGALFVPWQGEPLSPKDVERMTVDVRMAPGFEE